MNKKGSGWTTFWFIVACALIGIIIGFSRASTEQAQANQHYDSIADEYQKYIDTFEEDSQEMNILTEKYMLNSISTEERISIINEMIALYNLRLNHLNDHYNYIIYHETDLKAMGVDTYNDKKIIKDTQVQMKSVIEMTKQDVENRITYEAQLRSAQQRTLTNNQYDEYVQILQLLTMLI